MFDLFEDVEKKEVDYRSFKGGMKELIESTIPVKYRGEEFNPFVKKYTRITPLDFTLFNELQKTKALHLAVNAANGFYHAKKHIELWFVYACLVSLDGKKEGFRVKYFTLKSGEVILIRDKVEDCDAVYKEHDYCFLTGYKDTLEERMDKLKEIKKMIERGCLNDKN